MPRRPRLELPGVPLHVTQRGVNRAAIFIEDDDRHHYRHLLLNACVEHAVAVHTYVLMDNHVHLLLSAHQSGRVSNAMRAVGQCYVQTFNQRHGRSGTLWQGRFKSCLVDSDRYVLEVYRYIELNPVRAAMVEAPELHRWSSVHANFGMADDPLVTPHPAYTALAIDQDERTTTYRHWLKQGVCEEDLLTIRTYLAQERALGSARFQAMVERALNRPAGWRPQGRPRAAVSFDGD